MAYVHQVLSQAKFADYMQPLIAELRDICADAGPHHARADALARWRQRKIYWRTRKFFMMQDELVREPYGILAATGDYNPKAPSDYRRINTQTRAKLAALAFCLYFHFEEQRGAHQVWVLDIPERYKTWPRIIFANVGLAEIMKLLRDESLRFRSVERLQMAQAVQHAAAYTEKAHAVLSQAQMGNTAWKIVERWFADENTTPEMLRSHIATMMTGLRKIMAVLRSNKIVLLDHPQLRGEIFSKKDQDLLDAEAFVCMQHDPVCAIYVQYRFFSKNPVIKGALNLARIVIHEVTHKATGIGDERYATNGIRPNAASLPHTKLIKNCDSWAFCILDLAAALHDVEIARALIINNRRGK